MDEDQLAHCWRELEPEITSGDGPRVASAIRRLVWHALQIERKINYQDLDVKSVQEALNKLIEQNEEQKQSLLLADRARAKQEWWIKGWFAGMTMMSGAILAIILHVYFRVDAQVQENTKVNAFQTEIIAGMQEIQRDLAYEVSVLRKQESKR